MPTGVSTTATTRLALDSADPRVSYADGGRTAHRPRYHVTPHPPTPRPKR